MQRRKYKYLYQLICTSIILVIVPALLFYNVFWKKSFLEINRLNDEYYENVLTTFCGTFANEVNQFRQYISAFSVNSRSSHENGGIFYEGTKKMAENNYYYWEAAQYLSKYSQKVGYDGVGVYYYDKDILLIDGIKHTSERYITEVQRIEAHLREPINQFFSEEQYDHAKVIFSPLYDEQGNNKGLLLGVCTVLGKNKEKALMFRQLEQKDMEFFYVSTQGRIWEKYYILDGSAQSAQEVLYSIGSAEKEFINGTDTSGCFVRYNDALGLTFLIDVSGDEVQNNVFRFYYDMKVFFIYIIFIMIVICAFMVYINYKPIHGLLKQIKTKGRNECDTIRNIWEDQNDLLTEQRIMIMDLLMNHLLYGISISEKYIKKLGVSNKVTNYCVFLIEGQVLKAAEVETITKEVEENFSALLFITDLTGEKSTVIIAFMEHDKSEAIREWLAKRCEEYLGEEYQLRVGCTVEKLDEIQNSFQACIQTTIEASAEQYNDEPTESKTVSEKVRSRTEVNEKLKEEVLNYLDENYTDRNLSQTQLADYFQVSVYSLSKMFNNQIGMGFSKYINSKRIEAAKSLLITTELSVKEISNMVGVPDDNYFSRIFRKYVGVSPIEFRNENK